MSDSLSDVVSIEVGTAAISGWQSVTITRSVEQFPSSFTLTAASPGQQSARLAEPGARCTVKIGDDVVVTGYVDRYSVHTGARDHAITIAGRGLCQDLADCSADLLNSPQLQGGQVHASSAFDLAQKLAQAFGIKVRLAVSDAGQQIPVFGVALGETSYEIIESVCRYCGYVVYEDQAGTMVLDRVGTNKMASGFSVPGNVEDAQSMLAIDQRYSDYCVVWSSIDQQMELGTGSLGNQRAIVKDPTVPRYRPLIIVSEQTSPSGDFGQQRASWEKASRIGRSQAISLTCDSWRDSAGTLWQPNYLAPIDMAVHGVTGAQWLIGSVTYRKDLSGTHADVVVMPPDAFSPQPNPLTLWDNEIANAVPSPPSPAGGAAP